MKLIILISSFFLALAWLLPNHYFPWLAAYQDTCALLAIFLVALIPLFNQKYINLPYIPISLLLIGIIPFVQYFLGKIYFLGDAVISFLYILFFFIAVLVAYNLAINQNNAQQYNLLLGFSLIILFTSIISVWIQLRQWSIFEGNIWTVDLAPNGRPFANFGQPNNCATFLCVGLLACLYLYEKKYIQQFCGILLASYILFGITLTQSRTAWVFALAFLIWWFWKTRYFQTRLSKFSIFYFVVVFVGFIILLPYISSYLGVNNTVDIAERATTGYLRIPMWYQMLLAIQEQPLWGYGWNQVSVAQLSIYLNYPISEWTEHSHNILLDLLIWNGVPLGLTIIVLVSWWLYRLSKLATSIENFIALSMVGAVLVHAMLEYPLDYAFFLLPVGFLLGLVQAQDQTITVIKIPKRVSGVFLSVSIFLCFWVFIEYQRIDKDFQLVRYESSNIGTLHAEHDAPDVILLSQLREQIRFIRTQPKAKMTQNELDWMRQVAYRFATSANLYRYAQALALNQQLDEAKKHLLIIEKLHDKKYSVQSLYVVNKSLAFEWNNDAISTSGGGK